MCKKSVRVENLLAKDLEKVFGVEIEQERLVCPSRRWKFDVYLAPVKIAVEINGHKSHSSAKQRKSDNEKLNYAVCRGIRVLVYPASAIMSAKRRELVVNQIVRLALKLDEPALDACVLTEPLT